jgi:general secretion pathway protein K
MTMSERAQSPRSATRRRRRRRTDRRGVALIMVLAAITVLTVFLTELQDDTSAELSSALAERDMLRAEYHARSAINLSRLLIATEPAIRRSLAPLLGLLGVGQMQLPVWEFADVVLGPFNDASGVGSFAGLANLDMTTAKNLGTTGGRFELTIVDEDSKINVNSAARNEVMSKQLVAGQLMGLFSPAQYAPLFDGRDPDGQFSDRQTICGAIIDWADSEPDGNELTTTCDLRPMAPTATSAEDSFYQMLGVEYRRKNAAFDSLEEMRLVRGLGSDDFWSTFVDPDPADPRKRILSVWGQGKINIGSANAQTMLAVICGADRASADQDLCVDPMQLQAFVMAVSMVKSLFPGIPLFPTPQEFVKTLQGQGLFGPILQGLGVKPVVFKAPGEVMKNLANGSKVFSIYATGVVPGNRRELRVRIHSVIDFRAASALGAMMPGMQGAMPGGAMGSVPPGGMSPSPSGMPAPSGSSGPMTPDQMMAAMASDPMGQIVYWRVE